MKKILVTLLAFIPLLLFSQKDFEGVITYKGFKNAAQNSFEAKFFISNGKIKVKTINSKTDEVRANETMIYNFINGLQYFIDDEAKSYSIDSIEDPSFDDGWIIFKDTSLSQNILGYPCRAFISKLEHGIPMSDFLAIAWYSDSLRSTIPPRYRSSSSFQSLPDGNMLFLKSVVYMSSESEDVPNKLDSMYVIADKIERMSLDESEFLPPAGYAKHTIEELETIFSDSLKVDTSGVRELTLEEIKKESPKKPVPAKPSKPSQSPANKVKEPKPVKG